jgi:hypothetical protein
LGRIRRQIFGIHGSTEVLRRFQDRRADLALVDRLRPLLRHEAKRVRHLRIAEHLAYLRRLAIRKKNPHRLMIGANLGDVRRIDPSLMNHFRNRRALFRVCDCGLEQILPGQLAESLMHFEPAVHGAGNRHAVDAFLGHRLHAFRREECGRKIARRWSRSVQPGQLARRGLPVKRE